MSSTDSLSQPAGGDEQSLTPNRTTRATIKPGAIGQLKADRLIKLVDKIFDAFPRRPDIRPDVRWVHRYRELVPVYDKGEQQPKDKWRRYVVVTRELESPDLEDLLEWLRSNRDLHPVNHLEVQLSDGVRTARLEMGGSHNTQSHKIVVETTEPDDACLARAVMKAFHPIRERVAKRVLRAVWVWIWLPVLVGYLAAIAIDSAIKDNPPSNGASKTDLIVALGVVGGIAFLIASRYGLKRVRSKAVFSVLSSEPIPGSKPLLHERAWLAVRSFWQILDEDRVHVRFDALVKIVSLLLVIIGILVTILIAN